LRHVLTPAGVSARRTSTTSTIRRFSRVVLAVSMIAQGTQAAAWTGLAVMAPALRDHYDLSLPQVGVLLAAPCFGAMLTLLPWGFLADRYGDRATAAAGLAGCAAATLAAAFAPDFTSLVVFLALSGALGAAVNSATGRAVMGWYPRERRGFALGIRHMANPLGGLTAAAALPSILHLWGTRGALIALAVVTLAAALVAGAVLRAGPGSAAEEATPAVRPLRDRGIWRLSIGSAILGFAQLTLVGFVVLFLETAHGFSDQQAASVLAAIFVAGTTGNVVAGRLSDRLGRRLGLIRGIALATACGIGSIAALTGATAWLLVPALVIGGAFSMSWNGLSFAATLELAGRRAGGAAIGLQQTVTGVPVVITPLLFAPLVDLASWRVGFGVVALFPLAAFVVLRLVPSPAE
jgi:MFS family permease